MDKPAVIHLPEADSTNRVVRDLQSADDVVVWTDFQTAGRGCGTNTWESERGQNLLFSMLIHPHETRAADQFRISMAVSLAIVDAVSHDVGEGLSIKWPNDIYWHDRKLCGILIECQLQGPYIRNCVIGVGLNVNQTQFLSDAPNPVSMRQITQRELDRETVLNRVIAAFTADQVDAERYRSLLYRRDGFHPFRDAGGMFEARLLTVEDDGHLLLQDRQARQRRYAFKEVQFIIHSEIPK